VGYSDLVLGALGVSRWPPEGLGSCARSVLHALGAPAAYAVSLAGVYVDGGKLACGPRLGVPAAVLAPTAALDELAGAPALVIGGEATVYPVALVERPSLGRAAVDDFGAVVLTLSGPVSSAGAAAAALGAPCGLPVEGALAPVFSVSGRGVPGLHPDPGARPRYAIVDAVVEGGGVAGASLWSSPDDSGGLGVPVACSVPLESPSLESLASHLGSGRARVYRVYAARGAYFVAAGEASSRYGDYAVVLVEAPGPGAVEALAGLSGYSVSQRYCTGDRCGAALLLHGGELEDAERMAEEAIEALEAGM